MLRSLLWQVRVLEDVNWEEMATLDHARRSIMPGPARADAYGELVSWNEARIARHRDRKRRESALLTRPTDAGRSRGASRTAGSKKRAGVELCHVRDPNGDDGITVRTLTRGTSPKQTNEAACLRRRQHCA